jgi:ketosteroid isomerase-like protein
MTEHVDLAVRYGAAWAAHDPDAIVAMHTPDSVFHQHGLSEPAVGIDAVREAIAAVFAMVPDLAFDRKSAHFGEAHIVTEYVMSGTVDGTPFACDGVDVFQVRDGLMARKDTYLDTAGLQQQLEAAPAVAPAT